MGYISYFFSKTSSRVYLPIPIKGVDSRKNIFTDQNIENLRGQAYEPAFYFLRQ